MTEGWATIYCDASGNGNWAVWIRYSEFPYKVQANGISEYTNNSVASELNAIVQGVKLAVETWPNLKGVGVNSDCQPAINLAKWDAPFSQKKILRKLQGQLFKLRGGNHKEGRGSETIKIRLTWIKAHQDSNASTQAYLNNWCDQQTRKI